MLRVTVLRKDSVETWELEGKLAGEWVKELERCWKASVPEPGLTVEVSLKAVGYIDAAGKQLLAEMNDKGVQIKGCGCMARGIIEEVLREARAKLSQLSSKKILSVLILGACVLGYSASVAAREKSLDRSALPNGPSGENDEVFLLAGK